jgi:hypothetical protein
MACYQSEMAFRIVVVLIALFAADAYFWHGHYGRMAVRTAEGFASDFNYQIARLLQPLHH